MRNASIRRPILGIDRFAAHAAMGLAVALLLGALSPRGWSCGSGGSLAVAGDPPENCVTPVEQHPWGGFKPGAWKRVRVTTELLDEHQKVASQTVTETLTTLESIRECQFTLRIDVTVEVAGKRFEAQPQYVTQGINGEVGDQKATLRALGQGEIVVEGKTIPCQIKEVSIEGEGVRRLSTLYYSADVAPFLLKRATVATNIATRRVEYRTEVETLAVDMPYRVRNEMLDAAQLKTVHRHQDGETVTIETHCPSVPGGVVAHTSKELDRSGHLVKQSTLELVDFSVDEPPPTKKEPKRRLFFRRRDRRKP